MKTLAARPAPDEYFEYYAKYIERVPESDLTQRLVAQGAET